MECDRFVELLPGYLGDELGEIERLGFREHLARCARCRRSAVEREPTLALVEGPPPVPDHRVESVVVGVLATVRQRRLEARLRAARRRVLAAAAAVVLATGLGALALLGQRAPESGSAPPVVEVEAGPRATVYQPAADDTDTAVAFVVDPELEL